MLFLVVEGDPAQSKSLTLPVETAGGATFLCDMQNSPSLLWILPDRLSFGKVCVNAVISNHSALSLTRLETQHLSQCCSHVKYMLIAPVVLKAYHPSGLEFLKYYSTPTEIIPAIKGCFGVVIQCTEC